MADKRYYYLKLKQDFFTSKEIKKLRKIAGGDTYTIIYLRMLLMSAPQNGYIYFDGLCDSFAEEISLELDEDIDNVKLTLAYLTNIKAIEEGTVDEMYLNEINTMIGSECDSAERVRKHRRTLALNDKPKPKTLQCNTEVTKCNPILEIEIEKEIDIEKDIMAENPPEYESFFEDVWSLYPNKKGKGSISKSKKKELFKVGEDLRTAVENYKEEIRILKTEPQFIKHGSTFFKTGYTDYLPGTYQKPKGTGNFAGYEQRESDYNEVKMGWSDDI